LATSRLSTPSVVDTLFERKVISLVSGTTELGRSASAPNFYVIHSEIFRDKLRHLDHKRLNGSRLFDYDDHPDDEHLFLSLVFEGTPLSILNRTFPTLLRDILQLSARRRSDIVMEWNNFASELYLGQGRPVPDWPCYVEIQESLGEGTSTLGRLESSRRQYSGN